MGSLTSVSTWSPLQVMTETSSSDILIPVNPTDPQPGRTPCQQLQLLLLHDIKINLYYSHILIFSFIYIHNYQAVSLILIIIIMQSFKCCF